MTSLRPNCPGSSTRRPVACASSARRLSRRTGIWPPRRGRYRWSSTARRPRQFMTGECGLTRNWPATTYLQAHQARIVIRQSVANYFNQHRLDAMIMPATAGTAARADDPYLTYADGTREHVLSGYTRMTMPTNATGQPSISVPAGFTSAGLPIGMQIVGRPFAEARICRIGHAYEQAARWIDRRPALTQGA